MKKTRPGKLRLSRETLVLLDPKAAAFAIGGTAEENKTSCTHPCACPTGCTDDEPCIETGLEA
jgi:hypothetical protein